MLFPYQCKKCSNRFDGSFPIGQAPRETRCPKCKGLSKRVYEGMSIAVKIDGRTHGQVAKSGTFGEEMKRRNLQAAQRMKGKKPPVRAIAHDFGNGDVREIAKK